MVASFQMSFKIMVYLIKKELFPHFSGCPPPIKGNWGGGGETRRKIRQIEVRENILFYYS